MCCRSFLNFSTEGGWAMTREMRDESRRHEGHEKTLAEKATNAAIPHYLAVVALIATLVVAAAMAYDTTGTYGKIHILVASVFAVIMVLAVRHTYRKRSAVAAETRAYHAGLDRLVHDPRSGRTQPSPAPTDKPGPGRPKSKRVTPSGRWRAAFSILIILCARWLE